MREAAVALSTTILQLLIGVAADSPNISSDKYMVFSEAQCLIAECPVQTKLVSAQPIGSYGEPGKELAERQRANEGSCTKTVVPGQQGISSVVRSAVAGDVICVYPGSYHEAVDITVSGTAEAPIIIRGEGGRPIIDGQFKLPKGNNMDYSMPPQGCPGEVDAKLPDGSSGRMHFECTGHRPLVMLAGSYITFEGFEVVNSTGPGITVVWNAPLTNITIRNNYVHSIRYDGILLWKVNNALVEHNEVADAGNFAPFWRSASTLDWGSGIGAFASHSVSFVSNLIHDNWGDALLVDNDEGGSTDITVANNIFYDNYSSNGVYAHAVKRLLMTNNTIYCTSANRIFSSSSLRIAPTEPQYRENVNADDITVENNIFAGCPRAGPDSSILVIDSGPPTRTISNIVIAKNTIYNGGTSISAILADFDTSFAKKIFVTNNLIVRGALDTSAFTSSNNQIVPLDSDIGFRGIDGRATIPNVFTAGGVDPQWFRLEHYRGIGADLARFSVAGLLP
jgi:hypothetical protein